jgi:hypothetical protein
MGQALSFLSDGPAYSPNGRKASFTFGEKLPEPGKWTSTVEFGTKPYKGFTPAVGSAMTQGELQAAVEKYLLFFSSGLISGCFGSCDEQKLNKLAQLGITPVSTSSNNLKKVPESALFKLFGGKRTRKTRRKRTKAFQ